MHAHCRRRLTHLPTHKRQTCACHQTASGKPSGRRLAARPSSAAGSVVNRHSSSSRSDSGAKYRWRKETREHMRLTPVVLQRRKVLCDGLVRDVGQALRRPARRLVLIDQRSADPLEKVRRLPHEALASAELGAQACGVSAGSGRGNRHRAEYSEHRVSKRATRGPLNTAGRTVHLRAPGRVSNIYERKHSDSGRPLASMRSRSVT